MFDVSNWSYCRILEGIKCYDFEVIWWKFEWHLYKWRYHWHLWPHNVFFPINSLFQNIYIYIYTVCTLSWFAMVGYRSIYLYIYINIYIYINRFLMLCLAGIMLSAAGDPCDRSLFPRFSSLALWSWYFAYECLWMKYIFPAHDYSLYRQDVSSSSGGLLIYVRADLPHELCRN